MDLPAQPTVAAERLAGTERRGTLKVVLLLFGFVLAGILLFLTLGGPPNRDLAWLTPAEFNTAAQPGVFTRLKYDLMRLTGPVLRGFWRIRPKIDISSSLMTLSKEAGDEIGLGVPSATNSDGARSWILSPDNLQGLQERLKTMPGANVVSRPRISTANGIQSQLFVGGSSPAGAKSTPVGLRIDIVPRVAHGSIKLLVCVVSTETAASESEVPFVRTNLAVSCQAVLPNGGGLVVAGGPAVAAGGTNYWLIVSPTAIDANGKPIKF